MLSLIVYGRNDNHGYNLHKRVAISLNSFAEVLTGSADEVLFVDYNTPDDLPSFPEAIHDTLSPSAKRLLRVIRVRSSFHDRHFARRTHLSVLEPICRNIALRRSNPTNRWVLSTNTDMIFVPKEEGRSLTDLAAALSDGFYHLPRFEIPEALWESFDRLDGPAMIRDTRQLGRRYHLDEVVLSGPQILYDGPGDFQLALRQELYELDGFNEDMIHGWHVDSNLGARMLLKRGQIDTLIEKLSGYHCDHTRQATVYHTHDRCENDSRRFVHNVDRFDIPRQRSTWGACDDVFEEIRLSSCDSFGRYRRAVERALPAPQVSDYVSRYTTDSYNELDYNLEHVLPFVLDLLSTLPPMTRIGVSGCSREFLSRVAAAMPDIVPAGTLLLAEGDPLLDGGGGTGPQVLSPNAWIEQAQVLLFEFSGVTEPSSHDPVTSHWNTAVMERMSRVQARATDAVQAEHERLDQGDWPPRRFILLNAIHNMFEPFVQANLTCSLSPFSSRIRQGFVARNPPPAPPAGGPRALAVAVQRLMKRSVPPPPQEIQTGDELLEAWGRMREAGDPQAATFLHSYATPLAARLQVDTEFPAELRAAALEALARPQPEAVTPVLGAFSKAPAFRGHEPLGPGGGLYDIGDWDDPEWFAWAERLAGGRAAADWFSRSPWVWERVSLMRLLKLHDLLGGERRLLICAWGPDSLAATVSHYAPTYVGRLTNDWTAPLADPEPEWLEHQVLPRPGWLKPIREAGEALFDAVIAPQHALFAEGIGSMRRFMDALGPHTKQGGKLLFSGFVDLGERPGVFQVPGAELAAGASSEALTSGTPFRLISPQRFVPTRTSLERSVDHRVGRRTIEQTFFMSGSSTWMTGMFAAERVDEPGRTVTGPGSGPPTAIRLIHLMHTKPWVKATPEGLLVEASAPQGHALYGPYLYLHPGAYALKLAIRLQDPAGEGPIVEVEIAIGSQTLQRCSLAGAEVTHEGLDIMFTVPEGPAAEHKFEARISHFGRARLLITGLTVQPAH